jgi:hypothetical protein
VNEQPTTINNLNPKSSRKYAVFGRFLQWKFVAAENTPVQQTLFDN